MYNWGGVLGTEAAAGAALPFTGLNSVWLALSAFALLSAGTAILRLVPRREA
jgi:hypothetical protein